MQIDLKAYKKTSLCRSYFLGPVILELVQIGIDNNFLIPSSLLKLKDYSKATNLLLKLQIKQGS